MIARETGLSAKEFSIDSADGATSNSMPQRAAAAEILEETARSTHSKTTDIGVGGRPRGHALVAAYESGRSILSFSGFRISDLFRISCVGFRNCPYTASLPRMPSLTRMTSSAGKTRILPSPMLPVGTRAGDVDDCLQGPFQEVVVDQDFQLDLAQEVGFVLVAAVQLGPPALAAVALRVADGHPLDLDLDQRLAQGVELGGLDDGDDEFHGVWSTTNVGWVELTRPTMRKDKGSN